MENDYCSGQLCSVQSVLRPKTPNRPKLVLLFSWKLIFSHLWSSKWPDLSRVGAHAAIFLTLH